MFRPRVLPVLLAVCIFMAQLHGESVLTVSSDQASDVADFYPLNDSCSECTQKKKSLEIHFMPVGNKEIYCTFGMCCVISVLYSFVS